MDKAKTIQPGFFQEQDGAWSNRRLLAIGAFANSIALSWANADWRMVALFLGSTLVLLGLTTVSDLASLRGTPGKNYYGGSDE